MTSEAASVGSIEDSTRDGDEVVRVVVEIGRTTVEVLGGGVGAMLLNGMAEDKRSRGSGMWLGESRREFGATRGGGRLVSQILVDRRVSSRRSRGGRFYKGGRRRKESHISISRCSFEMRLRVFANGKKRKHSRVVSSISSNNSSSESLSGSPVALFLVFLSTSKLSAHGEKLPQREKSQDNVSVAEEKRWERVEHEPKTLGLIFLVGTDARAEVIRESSTKWYQIKQMVSRVWFWATDSREDSLLRFFSD